MKPMAWLLAAVFLCSFCGFVPFECGDVKELTPARILCAAANGREVFVCTDGGLAARGRNWDEALSELQNAAPGRLLLATVDGAVFVGRMPDAEELLRVGLRPATSVYRAPVLPRSCDELAEYLHGHRGGMTLGKLFDGAPQSEISRLAVGERGLVLEVPDA